MLAINGPIYFSSLRVLYVHHLPQRSRPFLVLLCGPPLCPGRVSQATNVYSPVLDGGAAAIRETREVVSRTSSPCGRCPRQGRRSTALIFNVLYSFSQLSK